MVVVSYSGKEINAKLVYYGAGLCGKTTNLEAIYEAVPETSRGKMVSMKTQSDRTLFFDLLPLDLGEIMGFKTRFLLYTVPGQVFYNATRKLVLKGADALVFVADSQVGKMDENLESLQNLRQNLIEYGLHLEEIPWVLQYNKRDLPKVHSVEEMNAALNPGAQVPVFESVASQGTGVFETFRGISHLLMQKVTRELHRSPQGAAAARAARAATHAPPRAEAPAAAVPAAPAVPPVSAPGPSIEAPRLIDTGVLFKPPAPAPAAAAARPKKREPALPQERADPMSPPPAAAELPEAAPLAFDSSGPPLAFELDHGRPHGADAEPARHDDPIRLTRGTSEEAMFSDEPAGLGRSAPEPTRGRPAGPSAKFEERELSLGDVMPRRVAAPVADDEIPDTAPTGRHEVVVPITIPMGEAHEIVLRISIRPSR